MINGYTIRKVNGQDVMYLFFDFNYEFSSFDFMAKREKIHDVVRNFIRDHNIIFKGATIALVAGGILFGSINLSTPSFSQVAMNNNVSIEEKVDDSKSDDIVKIEDVKENSVVNDNVSVSDNEVVVNSDSPSIVIDNTKSDSVVNNAGSNVSDVNNDVSVSEPVASTIVSEPVNEVSEVVVDNNIYVSVRRGDGRVVSLELEDYVTGVVGAEMPALFNSEALKAQAVIARTYALKANSMGRTLSDNESTQSYKDNGDLAGIWGSNYSSYYSKIKDAVNSTKGIYLTYNGNYIEAVYHSTSNGKTEDSSNVWGNSFPYLVSVDSVYDNSNPSFSISKSFSYSDISSKLGINVSSNTEFNILGYTSGGRVSSISVDGHEFSGVSFRSMLGLRSADFDIVKNDEVVVITTRGYGHGVGMSQYGANGMGKAGYSYSDILLHYYPGVSIEQL
ncbi:MAG: stage II sporulation protein D [Bacilli bacterium]